jgi:PIN domain nuclease of toxin-antitoxin system
LKLLLDTHVFLWAAGDDERLPAGVRRMLTASEHQLLVSVASLWEIVIKAAAGRLFQWWSPRDIDELERWVYRMGADILPIAAGHPIGTWSLRAGHHKDAFDRMLVAQAIAEGATLVTADAEVQKSPGGLHWIWPTD